MTTKRKAGAVKAPATTNKKSRLQLAWEYTKSERHNADLKRAEADKTYGEVCSGAFMTIDDCKRMIEADLLMAKAAMIEAEAHWGLYCTIEAERCKMHDHVQVSIANGKCLIKTVIIEELG